ncbi:Small conductance calcium-activated potassium channel protein 2 [Bagarius yarrelli]|uniref:Small conductance calcium-activated potassium channel protein 2 n=1 Tax=Bagarius yarrelli TaxID=175774 RepID=A0A556U190_BAGYA|nr:Small conductance calcium-activated potassium channel protein 2 [Bagarius yarrelli]
MEMNVRNSHHDSKADGLESRNGDTTDITVSLSHPGKRMSPIECGSLYRLRDRKFLLEDKRRLCACALGAALLGILLMIVHAELCPAVYLPGSIYALCINCLISFSTGCLLILIIAFHYKDIRLFIIDHNQVDWRIAMTTNRVLCITLELLVCSLHPVGIYLGPLSSATNSSSSSSTLFSAASPLCLCSSPMEAWLELELLLSALMFLRLYLVHRAILLHSKVLLSASYRSIGSLNNINFTFRFVLKVLMNKYPARTLLVFIMLFWFTSAWMLRLCESEAHEEAKYFTSVQCTHIRISMCDTSKDTWSIAGPSGETGDMGTALWLIAITFLTVGYGDVSPTTTCGKVVCLFAGVMGVACTAMLVAVVTKKLALNKGEKHVHFFMMDIQISKEIRNAAANVLRECWLLHRTIQSRDNHSEHRRHQRCLLEAIRIFRHLRLKQRKLRDYTSEMVDLSKMQMIMCDLSANWNNSYRELEQRIISMEQKLDELGQSFQCTSELLSQALQQRHFVHRYHSSPAGHVLLTAKGHIYNIYINCLQL